MQKPTFIEAAFSPPMLHIMISQKHKITSYFWLKNALKVYCALGQK